MSIILAYYLLQIEPSFVQFYFISLHTPKFQLCCILDIHYQHYHYYPLCLSHCNDCINACILLLVLLLLVENEFHKFTLTSPLSIFIFRINCIYDSYHLIFRSRLCCSSYFTAQWLYHFILLRTCFSSILSIILLTLFIGLFK